jgi:hypothetical protein
LDERRRRAEELDPRSAERAEQRGDRRADPVPREAGSSDRIPNNVPGDEAGRAGAHRNDQDFRR